jgi:hypothetical protein
MKNSINGHVTIIASNSKNRIIVPESAPVGIINPANVPPTVFDIIEANTVPEIIFGVSSLENHFIAKLEGELSTKIFPSAHRIDPTIAHNGLSTSIKILVQEPAITRIPPIVHPILVPNLSNI